ncbi:MAG TPA: hypothetical protein VJZ00_18000 [Thermoanaerobaculia bacterium]|nr:hypothetical protein [Thermoanaerobaculia bacterium]
MERFRWVLTAILSAFACHFVVVHATPIDRALPLLAVMATLLAWASYAELMIAVPLLMIAEVAFSDEPMRLLALGAVMACVVAIAIVRRPLVALLAAIVLLRWIPVDHIGRELVLLALAIAIFLVLERTPFAAMVAAIAALITPAVPLRTLALPILVLIVAMAARGFGMPRVRVAWASSIVVAFAVLFFPWSGIVARAFPYFLKQPKASPKRLSIDALPPSHAVTLDVPDGAKSLIVSGANVAHLRRGARLGTLQPGNVALTIGDAADWGYMRRDQFYGSRNPLPRDPAGVIRGYGYTAWLDGAGRVALPAGARRIRVVADASLPQDASLQVEGFE